MERRLTLGETLECLEHVAVRFTVRQREDEAGSRIPFPTSLEQGNQRIRNRDRTFFLVFRREAEVEFFRHLEGLPVKVNILPSCEHRLLLTDASAKQKLKQF
jgi:hypothetical protein